MLLCSRSTNHPKRTTRTHKDIKWKKKDKRRNLRPVVPVSLPSMFATPILFTLGVYEMRMPEGHKDAILNGFDASSNNTLYLTRAKRKARQLTSKRLGHRTCPSPASQSSCDRPCRIRLLLFSFGFALNSPRLPSMPFASALHPLLNKPCHVHVDPLLAFFHGSQAPFARNNGHRQQY